MAATADPRAKPPAAHHLEPWARQQQQPPRAHRLPVGEPGDSAPRDRRRSSSRPGRTDAGDPCDGGIQDLRAKLMGHLRHAADRLRAPQPSPPLPPPPPPKEKEPEPQLTAPPPAQQQEEQADVADKPWKLRERTRRRPAALTSWPAAPTPSRRRKRAPFSLALAPEEIEEDIYSLTGGRPRRRPRKRPRAVQRQLDSVFPGLWLTEITADDYKVPDPDE